VVVVMQKASEYLVCEYPPRILRSQTVDPSISSMEAKNHINLVEQTSDEKSEPHPSFGDVITAHLYKGNQIHLPWLRHAS
jgi:hypothetical protein